MTKLFALLERNQEFARTYTRRRSACPPYRWSSSPVSTTASTRHSSSGSNSATFR
jgi:hypothetical protein